jgi:hypothetical protein
MSNLTRIYTLLPALPQAGVLDRYREQLGVIVPVARTNLITNPSFETNTTSWTASGGSIARSTTQQYHGAYSLAITPTAGTTDGAYYGTVSLTSGVTYAVSGKVLGIAGVPYKLSVATTGGSDLVTKTFTGTGYWQWVWLFWTETSTTTRRVYVTKNTSTSTGVFYLDGVQVEACGTEGVFVTTYIDGDQKGYVANQSPPAYLWNGTRHASTSSRSGQTRAGGRIVKLQDFGFLLTALLGLGLATPRNESLGFAQLDGAQYSNVIKAQRSISLIGRWQGRDPTEMDANRSRVSRLLDRDRVSLRQELALCLQARECTADIGEPLIVPRAVYASGLEGNAVDLPVSAANITFTQYLPYVVGRDGGGSISQPTTITTNYLIRRAASGAWDTMNGGVAGGSPAVNALAQGLDGSIYVGGTFTTAGGVTTNNIAKYDPITNTYSALSATPGTNGTVNAIVIAPDGSVYVGGQFTTAGGVTVNNVAKYNPTANTWSALGGGTPGVTGGTPIVYALTLLPGAQYLLIGGQFTTVSGGAIANLVLYTISTTSLFAANVFVPPTVAGVISGGAVRALTYAPGYGVVVGGAFTSPYSYLMTWAAAPGTPVFAPVTSGAGPNASVLALTTGLDGSFYAGGTFTTADGLTVNRITQFTGGAYQVVGSTGTSGSVTSLSTAPDGTIYATGPTTIGPASAPSGVAQWNGATWTPPNVITSAAASVALQTVDGALYLGLAGTGTTTIVALTTVTNAGSVETYPVLTITGPTANNASITSLVNLTTGKTITFNLTINPGEVLTLNFDPLNLSFTSSVRGNIYNTILPGSQTALFALQPGANSMALFTTDSTMTAVLSWQTRYGSIDDALYQSGEP